MESTIFRSTRKSWFLACQHNDKAFDVRGSARVECHNFRLLGKYVVRLVSVSMGTDNADSADELLVSVAFLADYGYRDVRFLEN